MKKQSLILISTAAAISDANRSMQQICAENGFLYQEHQVITEDGYILKIMRIPGSTGKKMEGKPLVFFQHGILSSADGWITNYADVAPAFVASRAGYDVWLGNARGNIYSNQHETLDNKTKEYWDFDWQEMGSVDLKASFDYITQLTGMEKLAYIAHS